MRFNFPTFVFAIFLSLTLSGTVVGDCMGPPTTPVIRLSITACAVSQRYEGILRLTGNAHQVLALHHAYATESATDEFHTEDVALTENTFWIVAPNKVDCKTILQADDDIWFYGDVCNDVGENVPDRQLIKLRPEIKQLAKDKLKVSLDRRH